MKHFEINERRKKIRWVENEKIKKKEKVSYTIPFKNSYIYSILPRDKFLSCLTPRRN